jgi:uroporphyrinogen-III synthase
VLFPFTRNLEIKHLAQLKTILPEGYKFSEAPCLFEGAKTKSILIEMPELKDENTGYFVPQEDKRRDIFTERLYDHVKKHHEVTLYFFLILHKYILIANMTLGGVFF